MNFYLQRLHDELNGAIAGLAPAEREIHPERKWSVGEILEHLYLTYTGTVRGFEKCLAAGKPLSTTSTLRQWMRRLLVLRMGKLAEGREAPTNTRPRGLPAERVVNDILPRIAAMDEAIERCE